MTFEENLDKYAKLIVEVGVNIQKGQCLVIRTPIEGIQFARKMVKYAYENGAKRVYVDYEDEEIVKMTYEYVSEETLAQYPSWMSQKYNTLVKENAAFISISAGNPDLLKDVSPKKISIAQKAAGESLTEYRHAISNSDVCWCVVSMPTPAWSKKLYPKLSEKEAQDKLWDKIFSVTRIYEEDPVKAWEQHTESLAKKCEFLNKKRVKYLYYTAPGTHLRVQLPDKHQWEGVGEYSTKGTYFVANIPSEEIFTTPHKFGVDGTLSATKPLVFGGNLIEGFSFTFEKGRIVDCHAEVGEEILKELIETDEGSHYLGEVAIVPNSSPISQSNMIFFNTLFDENASCHFAIGTCYPTTFEGGVEMTKKQLEEAGGNDSIVHEDFMVGSNQLTIEAETDMGERFTILKNGEWAF